MEQYLMTHSLLSAWKYAISDDPYSDATNQKNPMDEFLVTLNRQSIPTNEAMQRGIDFENLVIGIVDGETHLPCEILDVELNASIQTMNPIEQHPWYTPAKKIADVVNGGIYQYAAKRTVRIDGIDFLLYGRLDFLKGGIVYDVKFSKSYDVGKFLDSTQHPMYLNIVPEAREFQYLVSDGKNVWTEPYTREETPDIIPTISHFIEWLKTQGLFSLFKEKWLAL